MPDLIREFELRRAAMVDQIADLVDCESPSGDAAALAACCEVVAGLGEQLLGRAPEFVGGQEDHLLWSFGDGPARIVLLGHYDTVWPVGTLARWPFAVEGSVATGPGCFDMKTGLVQIFHALSVQEALDGVTVLITADEEIGSPTSRELIETTARGATAALVAEPSMDGALKTVRKGLAHYRLKVTGRAAHAGLDPLSGANAAVELAHQILEIAELADPWQGTTVTPTVVTAGSTVNTVPAAAEVAVDVRAADPIELARVDKALRALQPVLPGTALTLHRVSGRPALSRSSSGVLFARARGLASGLGLPRLREASVGGGSDGNLTAGVGVPTLDGLGAVGGNAHAEGEWADLSALPARTALLAALVDDLRRPGGRQRAIGHPDEERPRS